MTKYVPISLLFVFLILTNNLVHADNQKDLQHLSSHDIYIHLEDSSLVFSLEPKMKTLNLYHCKTLDIGQKCSAVFRDAKTEEVAFHSEQVDALAKIFMDMPLDKLLEEKSKQELDTNTLTSQEASLNQIISTQNAAIIASTAGTILPQAWSTHLYIQKNQKLVNWLTSKARARNIQAMQNSHLYKHLPKHLKTSVLHSAKAQFVLSASIISTMALAYFTIERLQSHYAYKNLELFTESLANSQKSTHIAIALALLLQSENASQEVSLQTSNYSAEDILLYFLDFLKENRIPHKNIAFYCVIQNADDACFPIK